MNAATMPLITLRSGDVEINGIIFDMDGTLINSNIDFELMNRELISCLSRIGIRLPDAEVQRIHENLALLDAELSIRNMDEALSIRTKVRDVLTAVEMAALPVTPFEGILAMLDELLDRRITLGILTRASRGYTISALENTGIMDRIGALVCRDDHADDEAKPSPLAMHRTLELMNVKPSNAIYIGDHGIDMICANSSNVPFIGVLTGSTDIMGWKKIGCEDILVSASRLVTLFPQTSPAHSSLQ